MAYIYINLFPQREHAQLNPDEAVVRLKEQFPEAIVLPGDQMALNVSRAEANLDRGTAANRSVIKKLAWDAQHLGPAYAFRILGGPGQLIEGVIKRYQADFHSDTPISENLRVRLIAFLRSLVPAGVAATVCDEPDA